VAIKWGNFSEAFKAIYYALKGITAPPSGKDITKIGFWEDANGDIKYIKFYDGAELLFTLTFSDAGASSAETWNVTRT